MPQCHSVAAMAMFKVCGLLLVVCSFAATMTKCNASSTFSSEEISALNKKYEEEGVAAIYKTSGASQLEKFILHLMELLVHAPKFNPSPLHFEYRNPNQLKDGDVLVIYQEWMWKTYAVVSNAKEKEIICFATRDRHPRPVSDIRALFSTADMVLQEVSLDEVLGPGHGDVEVIQQENRARTLQNARAALADQRQWSFFNFNSEHFIMLVMTGKEESPQLDYLKSVGQKAFFSSIRSCMGVPECAKSLSILVRAVGSCIEEEVTKKVLNMAIGTSKLATVSYVVKQIGEEATEQMAGVTAKTATGRLASGAKAGLIGAAKTEVLYLAYTGISSGYKWWYDEISGAEFREIMVERTVAGGGSVAGSTLGAAIGTVIFPGAGTFIGSMVGGVAGELLGSKCGEEFNKNAF